MAALASYYSLDACVLAGQAGLSRKYSVHNKKAGLAEGVFPSATRLSSLQRSLAFRPHFTEGLALSKMKISD
jgi:hypothetical protein